MNRKMNNFKTILYKNMELYELNDYKTIEVIKRLDKLITKERLNIWKKKLEN